MNELNLDELKRMLELAQPKEIDFPPLNEFMDEQGYVVNELELMHSIEDFKEISRVKTTRGWLEIRFNKYLSSDIFFIMPKPNAFKNRTWQNSLNSFDMRH